MSNLPDVQENNEKLLNDIQTLQHIEQQFFTTLETNKNLPQSEQKKIIDKINQISNMRINLYQTLSDINNYYGSTLNTSLDTLKEQTAAIAIIEDELNRAKKNLEMLELEKNNKIRLVEINNYYGEKYKEHVILMKIIIVTLVPIIILSILFNKNLLPSTLYYFLLCLIIIIGVTYFGYRYISILMRDNMDYGRYDWPFNIQKAPKGNPGDSLDPWLSLGNIGTCIGSNCCSPGQMWNSDINQCIGSSTIKK
jgi:membrane-associated HD superfamily phosphohydrolase